MSLAPQEAESRISERISTDVEEERVFVATQWQLMWWRFRKHRAALVAGIFILGLYTVALSAEFLSSSDPLVSDYEVAYMQPQSIKWFDDGSFRPHVLGIIGTRNPVTFKKEYTTDPEVKIPIKFFVRGFEYNFLGFIRTDRHLVGHDLDSGRAAPHLFGTDVLGRDLLSRTLYGTRISMSIGIVGVTISLILGIVLGGVSGYYGGFTDTVVQRLIEILRSIPTIPLWIALAAGVPRDWSTVKIYFAITVIISLLAWTELGRVVRGRFLSLREEEFVTAARVSGATDLRIIFRHMVPSFTSHVIAAASLAIPFMIISETALSFLGLGLQAPAVSWGVLLKAAQNVQAVSIYPWLMIPALPVIVSVLAFNFMGDGLRDAADPYG